MIVGHRQYSHGFSLSKLKTIPETSHFVTAMSSDNRELCLDSKKKRRLLWLGIHCSIILYGGRGGCVVCACFGCVFVSKKATASSIKDTHKRMKPTAIIVRTAPISMSNPVVAKR